MHPRMINLLALAWFIAGSQALWGQEEADSGPAGHSGSESGEYLTFYLDNDLFSGEDQNYSNGVRLSWISANRPAFGYLPARQVLEKLSGADEASSAIRRLSGFERGDLEQGNVVVNYGLSVTQFMFTPIDFESPVQPPGERRYAGWLGVGFSLHARNERVLNSAELIFGTVGPRSYAQEAQDFIHDIRDIPRFQGWQDQVPNEFTLDLSFVQKRRLRFLERPARSFSMDGFTEWGTRLGTFRTAARVGGFVRLGFHLPADYSDPRISATAYSHRFFESGQETGSDWSLYGLAGVNAAGVLHDATLDGPLFKNFDTGIRREPWVAEVYLGFGMRWKALEFSYVHTFRSGEYKEQDGGFEFGSLALRVRL